MKNFYIIKKVNILGKEEVSLEDASNNRQQAINIAKKLSKEQPGKQFFVAEIKGMAETVIPDAQYKEINVDANQILFKELFK